MNGDRFLLVGGEHNQLNLNQSNQRRIQSYNERHFILFEKLLFNFFCLQGLKVWHQIIGISLANFPSFIQIFIFFFWRGGRRGSFVNFVYICIIFFLLCFVFVLFLFLFVLFDPNLHNLLSSCSIVLFVCVSASSAIRMIIGFFEN